MGRKIIGAAAVALAACASAAVARQTAPAPQYSASDFAKSMLSAPPPCEGSSEADCESAAKTRGFSLPTLSAKAVASHPAATAAKPGAKAATPHPRIVGGANILVTFRPGSAEITPQGRANLTSVAEGLKRDALAKHRFEVAGYTDPTGAAAVNGPLSKARAEAVMAVLVAAGVEPERLSAAGYGSDVLVAPDAPTDERNRRVEIHRLD